MSWSGKELLFFKKSENKFSANEIWGKNMNIYKLLGNSKVFFFFFFYMGFLSRTFTIYETAGKGGGYLFNSSLQLPPASETLRH